MNKIKKVIILLLTATFAFSESCNIPQNDFKENAIKSKIFKSTSASKPVRLNPTGPFLTSPSWSPDSRKIVTFGWHGIGLYIVDIESKTIETAGGDIKQPLIWDYKSSSFCAGKIKGSARFRFDKISGKLVSEGNLETPCNYKQGPKETENIIYESNWGSVVLDRKMASLKLIKNGREIMIEEQGAWGVVISEQSPTIAYAVGSLKESTVHVYNEISGSKTIGGGSYPSISPDGKFIVYSAHETDITFSGTITVIKSELYLYSTEDSKLQQLTNTPDIIEMQPSISPSNKWIAFSDWRGGGLYIMPIELE